MACFDQTSTSLENSHGNGALPLKPHRPRPNCILNTLARWVVGRVKPRCGPVEVADEDDGFRLGWWGVVGLFLMVDA